MSLSDILHKLVERVELSPNERGELHDAVDALGATVEADAKVAAKDAAPVVKAAAKGAAAVAMDVAEAEAAKL